MQHFTYTYHFSPIPRIFKRGRHALIVVKAIDGKYLLGGKTIYPDGIYRFVGGGIDSGEDPQVGAARELEEELHIHAESDQLQGIAKFTLNVSDGAEQFVFETFVYLYQLQAGQEPIASDDVQSLKYLSREEMLQLAERYKNLPNDLVTVGSNTSSDSAFRWSDYGQFYGDVHKTAVELSS